MVREADFVKALQLERVIAPEGKTLPIEVANVNRPGLQLAGYWDFFGYERPQLLGKVEMTYLSMLDDATRRERLAKFFSYALPCIIICRGLPCFDEMLVLAAARKIPIYRSLKETTRCEMEVITFLSDALAPRETRHGVLVDVYGSGLFITGNSGVGKSEAALELVKRGPSAGGGRRGGNSPGIRRAGWWARPRSWCGISWRFAAWALSTWPPCTA